MRFEDLDVWKRATRLSAEIFRMARELKDWRFRDQLTRAGMSIPSNIAEGFERQSNGECLNFLSYAKGSCGELRTHIHIGIDVGYISKDKGNVWIQETREISRMRGGLIKTRKRFLNQS